MATYVALQNHLVVPLASFTRWQPSRPITREVAVLVLAEQPMARIRTPWLAPDREELRGQTEASFDDFIENGRPPFGLFKATFGRTGIAQMEVLAPKPGVRLFGGFADPQCFVGLRLFQRDDLPFKPTGQKGVIDYRTLGEMLLAEWQAALPGIAPMPIEDL